MKTIAILLDGGFVRYRLYNILGKRHATADDIIRLSKSICLKEEELFRIYYYDCPPYLRSQTNPLLKTEVDFAKTPTAKRIQSLHDALAHKDHVAFRRGKLSFRGWGFNPGVSQELLRSTNSTLSADRKQLEVDIRLPLESLANKGLLDLTRLPDDDDEALSLVVNMIIKPEMKQKRVDIKIGLDVAWLASRGIVDRIALVTGDTDFIPAMKFARREGVQVVLIPLGQKPSPDLVEHADEVRHVKIKKKSATKK